jgi:hydrogenase maturation protease
MKTRILVAGIGNIFFGDDAFGVEVAKRLMQRQLPDKVRVVDFGIRSYDLAYALVDGCDAAILIDALPRGEPPGTLTLLELDMDEFREHGDGTDAHDMNLAQVFGLVRSLGGYGGKLYLVGCEPGVLETEDGRMGLSENVEVAVPHAIEMIESLVAELLGGGGGETADLRGEWN